MNDIRSFASFSDLRAALSVLPGPDAPAAEAAQAREPQLTKPPGSLGRLEQIAEWLATWQGRHPASLDNVCVRVFAGNHGVVAKGVSAYPAEVTVQMVGNFEAGGAAINQLCKAAGAELKVAALDLDQPTADFTEGPAMAEDEFLAAFNVGMASVPDDCDLLGIGEMGIGNTSAAAAICLALYGGEATDWTGPGTGVSGDALNAKARIVAEGVHRHEDAGGDGLEILRRLGGRELAAMAGAIVAARLNRVPLLLDGYVTSAAAAALHAAQPSALDHCLAAHVSAEPAHRQLLVKLGKPALLDFGMRLGEASGAALAIGLVRSALACHTGMATFAEAGVSDKD
ncbi:MAG: nicotinate-nucleotide--dimethylbenzimidazole phosphoribosyltransferase [Rhodospirillaceae bacterium]|nr:nicotinate-nucleotide--dimethylbenzimidazole phosphoribosyltransferase [Rhodospirillaceae bacterium]